MPQFYISLLFIFLLISCSESPQEEVKNIKLHSGTANKNLVLIEQKKYDTDKSVRVTFKKTTDGSNIKIPIEWFHTKAAKEFLNSGKNNYIGNPEMISQGKKRYNMWSCSQCHGPTARGQVGPGLTGPNFKYAKNATNIGMFETIWAGTNGGMGAKGFGLMTSDDGIKPDELLKIIAFIRSNGKLGGNQ